MNEEFIEVPESSEECCVTPVENDLEDLAIEFIMSDKEINENDRKKMVDNGNLMEDDWEFVDNLMDYDNNNMDEVFMVEVDDNPSEEDLNAYF